MTRLRLVQESELLVAQLTAMTVNLCDEEGYAKRAAALGPDPLREDADPERLWAKWESTPRSVGALLMDQSAVAGVGNIFRAEILFKAGVHPEQPAETAGREAFERVWSHCLGCLQAGFRYGSIRTVDPEEAKRLGPQWQRRYIYNQATCGRCSSSVLSWTMATRTVYCCPCCQPLQPGTVIPAKRLKVVEQASGGRLFSSTCAPDTLVSGAAHPTKLKIRQLRELLAAQGLEVQGSKSALVARLIECGAVAPPVVGTKKHSATSWGNRLQRPAAPAPGTKHLEDTASTAAGAAAEKMAAGEKRSVEHVAEMDDSVLQVLESTGAAKTSKTPKKHARVEVHSDRTGPTSFPRPLKAGRKSLDPSARRADRAEGLEGSKRKTFEAPPGSKPLELSGAEARAGGKRHFFSLASSATIELSL